MLKDFYWFPSPCGDVVLKYVTMNPIINNAALFPSPCGDVVLKFREKPRL